MDNKDLLKYVMSKDRNDESEKLFRTDDEYERIRQFFDKDFKDYVVRINKQQALEEWDNERYHEELEKHPCYRKLPPKTPEGMSDFLDKIGKLKIYEASNKLAQNKDLLLDLKSKNDNDVSEKALWTEAERAEITAKFNQELLDYGQIIERQRALEQWNEERFLTEMKKHPSFMREPPKNPKQLSEFIEKVQQLKLSMKYQTPNELAHTYKEDGNKMYQNKEYSQAEYYFGKGIHIAIECENKELLAQLYNNRALAYFKMAMYRQSLVDCKQALEIKSDFLKPMQIAAKCCYRIKDFDQCISYCDQFLLTGAKDNDGNKEIVSLKAKAVKSKVSPTTDSKLKGTDEKAARKIILDAIKSRDIKLDDSDIFYDSQAIFRIPVQHVRLHPLNFLVWPVFLRIIEYDQSILIQDFQEFKTISQLLEDSLNEPPMKDNKQYQLQNLNVYFDGDDGNSYKIDIKKSLAEILKQDKFIVRHGAPTFDVVVANSIAENALLFLTLEKKRTLGRL